MAALVINQIATQARDERRHRHNIDDRKQAELAAAKERADVDNRNQKERQRVEEKASQDRRRVMRHLRNLRPDQNCYQRGCPLATPGNVAAATNPALLPTPAAPPKAAAATAG